MTRLTKDQVHELARASGIQLDDQRAEVIASRLGGVLDELDAIPAEALADVEPLLVFTPSMESDND